MSHDMTAKLNTNALCTLQNQLIKHAPFSSHLFQEVVCFSVFVGIRTSVDGRIIRQKIWPKCPKLDGQLRTSTSKVKWLAYTYIRRKLISRGVRFDDHSALLSLW